MFDNSSDIWLYGDEPEHFSLVTTTVQNLQMAFNMSTLFFPVLLEFRLVDVHQSRLHFMWMSTILQINALPIVDLLTSKYLTVIS